jgi:putative flippase GtrA
VRALAFQMFRFGLVGLVNAGVDAVVFFSAVALIGRAMPALGNEWQIILSNTASFAVAVTCSYFLNSRFTFKKRHEELDFRGYILFVASQVAGFVAHTVTLVVASKYLPLPLAKLCGIGVGFVVNFTLARAFVFRNA